MVVGGLPGICLRGHDATIAASVTVTTALRPLRRLPTPADVRMFRLMPTVISLLDYSKGFGHTDLITC